jgi:PleD family two-component response regulator/EAL domain-containing protein (putative c-di-GMP-specific phosphodiesterase class I)
MTDVDSASQTNRICYLGDDSTLCMSVAAVIQPKGLMLQAFKALPELEASIRQAPPRVVILDLRQVSAETSLADSITHLKRGDQSALEIICIGDDDSVETRLEAMRAGAGGYFTAPIVVADLAKRVITLAGLVKTKQAKILVVEDDPVQAKYASLILQNAGMEAHVVDDPLQVMKRMHEVHPDLVLMDLYMPGATGAELTAIIRDTDEFYDIPVIFLSAETDIEKQQDALKLGGDSFLAKPVKRDQLIGAIDHRIRMSRWVKDRRSVAERRELPSGILQKQVFLRRLDQLVHSPEPIPDGVGLLLIELDRPQDVLEGLGVKGMERLLRQLEEKVAEQLAAGEFASRLDDFTLAILARREGGDGLDAFGARLLQLFASTKVRSEDRRLAITVSIGVGLFDPPADDAITLVSRGRTALTRAKNDGGNRARVWRPVIAQGSGTDYEARLTDLVQTAIAQDGLFLMFQPIVSLGPSAGELYEVQVRLRTREGEHVPAADFLPVAERAGLMPRIDRWVLEHALAVMEEQSGSHPKLRLLIHQTIASVDAPDWLGWFRDQIVQRSLIRRRPILQFQLRDVREHLEVARSLVVTLRKYGIQVCIASVSGHPSDLKLLADLGITMAKLAFATLQNADQDDLTEMVQQLRKQGTLVIAAGIEDQLTISRVWNCRPDFIQGNSLQMPSSDLIYDFHQASDDL